MDPQDPAPPSPTLPTSTQTPSQAPPPSLGAASGKPLSPAALRALEEAAARRAVEETAARAAEQGGPAGPEPTRFGDWERKGIAVDF